MIRRILFISVILVLVLFTLDNLYSSESFYRSYVLSIVSNKDTDDNNLHILQTYSVGKR